MSGGGRVRIGVDLAWGPNGRTGLAAVDPDGRLVDSASVATDDEIDAWIGGQGPVEVAAIDAPIVVPNATGRREAERLVAAAFARYDAGPHPTNRSLPWMDPPRARRLAERHGWAVDPALRGSAGSPVAIEVYPHPGMVGLFGLGRVLPYKKGAIETRRPAFARLLELLQTVASLRLDESDRWTALTERFERATRPVDLDRLEDEVDAIFCAHLAHLWSGGGELVVYGDRTAGFIVAPPAPQHAPAPRGTAGTPAPEPEEEQPGVGPYPGPWPDDPRLDPELLEHGDRRNVVDRYRYWSVAAVVADLDARRHPFAVAVENWQHDLNIGSIVRTANAFLASSVHVVGRRRWNRRGAMVTDRYQHVLHHETVADLLGWAAQRGLPVIAVDNVPGAVALEAFDLPERCVLLFGQEGPGLSAEALAGASAVVEIPQYGSTRSINAAAAAAIVMHEWVRRWAR